MKLRYWFVSPFRDPFERDAASVMFCDVKIVDKDLRSDNINFTNSALKINCSN